MNLQEAWFSSWECKAAQGKVFKSQNPNVLSDKTHKLGAAAEAIALSSLIKMQQIHLFQLETNSGSCWGQTWRVVCSEKAGLVSNHKLRRI